MPQAQESTLLALYKSYSKELHSFARRRVGDDEAADVVQDTYLRALRYVDHATLENPRAYLYRVAANAATDRGLATKARTERIEAQVDPDDLHTPRPGPEAVAESRQQLLQCVAALDELPAVCRHAFLLHRIDGLSQGEVAKALNIPKRTVERYIANALAHCLARLGR